MRSEAFKVRTKVDGKGCAPFIWLEQDEEGSEVSLAVSDHRYDVVPWYVLKIRRDGVIELFGDVGREVGLSLDSYDDSVIVE